MFRCNHHHQGAYYSILLKLLKLHMQPQYRINHTDVFQFIILTTVTLARSNNAPPDDGDCTETCRSCFNVNFNAKFKIVF
jgi:hypothetical protein